MIFFILTLFLFKSEENPAVLFLKAQDNINKENYQLAEEYLKKALLKDPESSFLKIEIAKTLIMKGDFEKAKKIIDEIKPSKKEFGRYFSVRFFLNLMNNDIESAKKDFENIKGLEISNEDKFYISNAIMFKIYNYLSEDKLDDLAYLVQIYLNYFPENEEMKKVLLGIYIQKIDLEKTYEILKEIDFSKLDTLNLSMALNQFYDARDLDKIVNLKEKIFELKDKYLMAMVCDSYFKKGEFGEYEECLKKIIKIYSDDIEIIEFLLNFYIIDGKYEEAENFLKGMPKNKEEEVNFILRKEALLNQLKGNFISSEKNYLKLLNKFESKERIKILKEIYNFYKNIGCFQKSLEYGFKILEEENEASNLYYIIESFVALKDKENALFYLNLYNEMLGEEGYINSGWLLLNYGFIDDAEALLKNIENFISNKKDLFALKGYLYFKKRKIEEMKECYLKFPEDPLFLNNLGYFLLELGELKEGLPYLIKAAEIAPFEGNYLDSLGWAYFKNGEYEKAYDLLKKAIFYEPFNSIILDHYGDVLVKIGNYKEAFLRYIQSSKFWDPEYRYDISKLLDLLKYLKK